jgi:hypothetical protein
MASMPNDETGEDEERELRMALMRADLNLKTRQTFWETPKGVAAVVAATAVLVGGVAGLAGYKIGSQPSQTIIIQVPPQPQGTVPPNH